MIRQQDVFLIEVKSLANPWGAAERIRSDQLRRLRLSTVLLAGYQKTKSPESLSFRAFVAWVCPENRVSFTVID